MMRRLWAGLAILLLTACGNVDSGTGSSLSLRAEATGIKSITFKWGAFTGATHYKLFVDPDGASGYTQVGGDLTATSTVVAVPVHLTDWLNARYLVEAHNAMGRIATSSPIGIATLLANSIGYLKASNTGSGDNFGFRVAVSGDGTTLAVSASGEDSSATGVNDTTATDSADGSGAVYLFVRSGESWIQQAYIKASNTDASDGFGSSLALSGNGNTLAVGATGEDGASTGINNSELSNTASNAGAVYLFTRSGTTWSQQAYIKASNTDPGDAFGSSVALSSDGNTLAVGASGEASSAVGIDGDQLFDTATGAGAVYLFLRTGSAWSQQAYIKASNTDNNDAFGTSVALSSDGNTLAVGALNEASEAAGIDGDQLSDTAPGAGAVYLFTRSGSTWGQQAYIKASNSQAQDHFGGSVTLSADGNTLAVGAVDEDSALTGIGITPDIAFDTAASAGAVYLFSRSGSAWSQQAYVKASNSGVLDNFGVAVALSGDGNLLAVGAHQEDSSAVMMDGDQLDDIATDSGAVYLYRRVAGVWSTQHYVKAPNTDQFDNFGESIALTGDGTTLVVGAGGEDSAATGINGDMTNNILGGAGAAYLY